jgi:hypothetical protein
VKGWRTRALVVFVFYFYLSPYLPLLWCETRSRYQLLDLQSLNPFVGAGIGVLIYELFVYVWHRTRLLRRRFREAAAAARVQGHCGKRLRPGAEARQRVTHTLSQLLPAG